MNKILINSSGTSDELQEEIDENLQDFADAFGPVFGELSGQFDACVRVIRNVREHDAQDPVDPMVVIEIYLLTG